MIAASDPLEYIPSGRQTVARHPGYIVNQLSNNQTLLGDSVLLQKFSQVNISEKSPKEFWRIRENETCEEEELYCSGKVAVHSKGSRSTRVLQTSYSCETDIKHALWCTFCTNTTSGMTRSSQEDPNGDEGVGKTIECICLIDSYTLKVFTENGEDYVSSLQFQVSAAWSTKYGIILEKSQVPTPISRFGSLDGSRISPQLDTNLPVAFSLMHPLDETCPLLIKHGRVSYMCDSNQQIIYTSSEPSLAVIYDTRTGLHSVYKIRRAFMEECQIVCGSCDSTASVLNHSTNISPLAVGSASLNKSTNKTAHLSLFGVPNPQLSGVGIGLGGIGLSSSPFNSRGTSYTTTCSGGGSSPQQLHHHHHHHQQQQQQQQSQHSRSQSPMATISRCQSPTHSAFSPILNAPSSQSMIHHMKIHQTVMAALMGQSQNSFGNCSNSMQFQDVVSTPSRPLYPEICLDHVWTENSGVPKETISGKASRVLLTSDLVGQSYLGYLVPSRSQLFLVRLEKTNKQQQIIFGMVSSIVAKDAVSLPALNMIATMDLSNGVTLYSGVTFIGKVHISGILPNFSNCNYFFSNVRQKHDSSFPRRSSLISQNAVSSNDVKFDEGLHFISPVGGVCNNRAGLLLENSMLDTSLMSLKDAVGNKVTLEYSNKTYHRITLPTSSTSPLVTKCLKTLKTVLQRDLAMQLLVKWYSARNAPGPQDSSPEQEWNLFLVVLFTLLGYEVDKLKLIQKNDKDFLLESKSPMILPKKQKTSDTGSNEDWNYLIHSSDYENSKLFLSNILGLNSRDRKVKSIDDQKSKEKANAGKINSQAILFPYIPLILFSLHLLYEELKLNTIMSESLLLLAQLLFQLSLDLKFHQYSHNYFLDFPVLYKFKDEISQIGDSELQKLTAPNYMSEKPANIFEYLFRLLKNDKETSNVQFPHLFRVNPMSKNMIYLFASISNENKINSSDMEKFIKFVIPAGSRIDLQEGYKHEKKLIKDLEDAKTENIVLLYHKMGLTKQDLEILPVGISLILKDLMYRCREKPPSDWPKEAYELIDRQDLAALDKHTRHVTSTEESTEDGKNNTTKDPEHDDGMEFDDTVLKLRFNEDHRVSEVRRLLNSSKPVRIAIVQRPDVSDHEFIEEQERHLHALCTRTMALPVARGMFTLRTSRPIITEQLPIPQLCLSGKAPPRGTTVELAHIDVPPNMNLWPLFHNGVAAGLRIHPNAPNIDSTWIVYNKQQQGEFGIEHSGFLMALGLNGHLKNLAPCSMYEYLVECHEATSVGLLLGLSATHRASMNVSMTKLLSLHVETLLPPTSIELNVQQNVQVAALMGVGLVYQGTAHRHIAHALLSEIGRPPGPEMKNCVDRESYSLAAGLALGLVVLGCGGGPDLANIPDTLHYYMVGGYVRPLTGAQKDKYKSPSYQIREGDSINIDVTSPGATIALGLMYFNTGNRAVAEWMKAPETQYLLDFVRPDLLLLRVLAKSLILWDEIEPTKSWVSSHVPNIVYRYRLQRPTPEITQNVDLETMNQAYCNIIAGACMALGLKFAGTANKNAFKTLYNYAQMFTELSHKSIAELAGKSTIETCLNVVLLSAAAVMAGTGDLSIMRICRHVRTRVGPASSVVTYGSHLATHMALGLLFLGGGKYTLSNSPSAVAALIISLFPKFPTHSNDNRYHLQALRHLYVLAVEPRLILPMDIDKGQFCYATIHLTFQSEELSNGQEVVLRAPCLLPQLHSLVRVELKDSRYWEISFERGHNWSHLEGMLKKCDTLDVKQRAGCLSYLEDPHGFRSLVAQTLTTENVVGWSARPEHITSFTNDKTVLNIVKHFLQNPVNEGFKIISCYNDTGENAVEALDPNSINCPFKIQRVDRSVRDSESQFLQIFIIIVYECVIKDKVSLLPFWLNLMKNLEIIKERPNSFSVWQLKLSCSHILKGNSSGMKALISTEWILAVKQRVSSIMNCWENEINPVIKQYITGKTIKANDAVLAKLTAYLVYYSIPHHIEAEEFQRPFPTQLLSNTSTIAMFKLRKIMKSK